MSVGNLDWEVGYVEMEHGDQLVAPGFYLTGYDEAGALASIHISHARTTEGEDIAEDLAELLRRHLATASIHDAPPE